MKKIDIAELPELVGSKLGTSSWLDVTQEMINTFASNTYDQQYIHIDPARAKLESPYGKPIAHGFFVLSLSTLFCSEVLEIQGCSTSINYGVNRVRFPNATPVGSRIRGHVSLLSVEEIERGVKTIVGLEVEIQSEVKPACVAELVALHYTAQA